MVLLYECQELICWHMIGFISHQQLHFFGYMRVFVHISATFRKGIWNNGNSYVFFRGRDHFIVNWNRLFERCEYMCSNCNSKRVDHSKMIQDTCLFNYISEDGPQQNHPLSLLVSFNLSRECVLVLQDGNKCWSATYIMEELLWHLNQARKLGKRKDVLGQKSNFQQLFLWKMQMYDT